MGVNDDDAIYAIGTAIAIILLCITLLVFSMHI